MAVTANYDLPLFDGTDTSALDALLNALSSALDVALASTAPPSGSILSFAGSSAPAGWLLCQGQAVSRTTYAKLFTAIGTAYGAGDGSGTFNIPNLKGRIPAGVDSSQTEFTPLGKAGGAKTHKLTVEEMPAHAHNQNVTAGAGGPAVRTDYTGDNSGQIYPQGIATGSTGGDGAHNNLQPYLALHYIIKA